ncbi:DUF3306 domain-containing protein [Bradyrhizobium sp. C-145]|uniref:DUF3306 domain-containing protein n=1 Tax=Bradyrhizobium sp. C-145 TaxID=574727 RepID=UPI00201B6D90|nr:DUF3306 domain-containing protein [Bradyrhizobium sp. C-145]UQR62385.1 DUF3306 domain-containing protein [Bradyrhizobium sp. C-145]
MSNDLEFLARWSRRKHHAATEITQSKSEHAPDDLVPSAASLAPGEIRLPFDPTSFPRIESIAAESNIRAFLGAGVPVDLARAALRRVWSLDPAIRDFVGLSENSWDFNASGAMTGFGPIDGEEVGRLLTRLVGEPDTIAAAVHRSLSASPANDPQIQAREPRMVEQQGPNLELVAPDSAQDQRPDLDKTSSVQHSTTEPSLHNVDVSQPNADLRTCREVIVAHCLRPVMRGRRRTTVSFQPL